MGIMKKSEFIETLFCGVARTDADEKWVKKFLETEELDQLLYYLELSLAGHRAKFKILRNLEIEKNISLNGDTAVVILEDCWIESIPYDQFLKKGSFIWTDNTIMKLKNETPVYKIGTSGLEAILPWILYKIEKDTFNGEIPSVNSQLPAQGHAYKKFVGQPIIILSAFIAINFFVQSNSIKLANSGTPFEESQLYGIYSLLIFGILLIFFFPFENPWNQISDLITGFMKRFKSDRFERKKRSRDSLNTLTLLLDLISPDKAIIPLTALLSLIVSLSFLYDTLIGICAVLIFGAIYFIQHLALESRAKSQLANTLSAQSVFLDAYRSLPLLSATARKNGFMVPLKKYWQSLSESFASAVHAKDKSALWYQTRLALIRTILVQIVFLLMVLLLGLEFVDYVSFSAIQMALTVITGPTHDLFKRLKDYTNFSIISGQFTPTNNITFLPQIQQIKCNELKIFGSSSSEINFTFSSSNIYSIVGKTGSGKSELVKILSSMACFSHGTLQINDKVILANEAWRIKSIFITEELPWRGGRIVDFLTAQETIPDMLRLRNITNELGIDAKIILLPDGYETEVEEVNMPFSHAEQMLLSLTRAYYSKFKIIVFDNVLNRADRVFQKSVFNFLKKNSADLMIFIIDNDFEIIENSNYALVIDQGAIADHGPPHELVVISDKLKRVSRPTQYFKS